MNKINKETWYFVCIDSEPIFAGNSRRAAYEIGEKLDLTGRYIIEKVIISEVKK